MRAIIVGGILWLTLSDRPCSVHDHLDRSTRPPGDYSRRSGSRDQRLPGVWWSYSYDSEHSWPDILGERIRRRSLEAS